MAGTLDGPGRLRKLSESLAAVRVAHASRVLGKPSRFRGLSTIVGCKLPCSLHGCLTGERCTHHRSRGPTLLSCGGTRIACNSEIRSRHGCRYRTEPATLADEISDGPLSDVADQRACKPGSSRCRRGRASPG